MRLFKKRDRLQIIAVILEYAKPPGILRTKLMYKANLHYSNLTKYLKILTSTGLLQKEDSIYKTTSEGLRFLDYYSAIKNLLTSKTTHYNSEE